MKTKSEFFKILLFVLLFSSLGRIGNAQTFNYFISNDHLVSPTVFEFDISIQNTSGTDFLFRTVQQCITFNAAFINGATVTAAFVSSNATGQQVTSSQLVNFKAGAPVWSAAANGFQTSANTGVTCFDGTIIPASGTPLRVATMRLTATAGVFGCAGSNPNMAMTGDVPAPSGLALRMAVTKWNDNTCAGSSNTTITGPATQYTRFSTLTQYGQVNNNRPTITAQPVSPGTICSVTGNAIFSLSASGNGLANPLGYQWYENGVPLSNGVGANGTYAGAQTASLQITNPSINLNGFTYYCSVLLCTPSLSTSSVVVTLNVNTCVSCVSPPLAVTGGPYSSCGNVILNGSVSGSATGGTWSSPTAGTFTPNATALNATYQPSAADLSNGSVTLTLTTNNPSGPPCVADAKTVTVTFTTINDNNLCTADACDQLTGLATHTPVVTDDGNSSTNDGCDPASGVYHIYNSFSGIPYQAIARNNAGTLIVNQSVSLRFSIHDATAAGTVVYKETRSVTTNSLGLFAVNIGQGTPVTGIFSNIDWSNGLKFIQVEMDVTGGSSYIDMGTQQMLSVPYALYAGGAASISKFTVMSSSVVIPPFTTVLQSYSATGVVTTSTVFISPAIPLTPGLVIAYARVSTANTVEVGYHNASANTVPLNPGIPLYLTVFK